MNNARAVVVTLLLAACAAERDEGEPVPPPPLVEARGPAAPVPNAVDPSALAEVLAKGQAPKPPPTGRAGTLLGSDTGAPERDEPPSMALPAPPESSRLQAGTAEFQPALSSPAIELAARAQLYWRLRSCRLPDGSPPPPESITLGFTIRPDGSVDPASVSASAEDDALAEVASCALRTFSASPFIGPEAGLETSSRVVITWPSVD
jgi:hypothetical protein